MSPHFHPTPARWLVLAAIVALLVGALPLSAQAAPTAQASNPWSDIAEGDIVVAGPRWIVPQQYRTLTLDVPALQALLASAPQEFTPAGQDSQVILALPLPEGGFGRFRIVGSPIMAPELAAQFPEITTYAGQGIDDPTATTRFDWTPHGFHAIIFGLSGTVYIDPFSRNDTTHYISYYARDFVPSADKEFIEILPDAKESDALKKELAALVELGAFPPTGPQLRTYRLAVAATGEYTAFHGGTVPLGLAAIVTSVNRVDGVYEREVAVRMVLIANNNLIVYTNAGTDPYTNGDGFAMLGQNQSNLDAVIGNANYDIGHVFSTGGGGVAGLGVVCVTGQKARGVTGSSAPVGDPFDIDYVAHEMGHQFAGNHSFNGNAGSCSGGNRNGPTAYEPGSGSTIMAYAGICGAQNLQPNSDDYFHGINLDEITAFTSAGSGSSCDVVTNTGNSAPTVNAGAGGFTIPAQTPFSLTGSATDPNGDALTYNWEEFDLGAAGAPNNPLAPPFFRSWPSTISPTRTFPRLSDLVNNTTVIGEVLPNVTRALNFRLTARDNRSGGGGVNSASIAFNVTTAAGPFQVTAPNTAVSWTGTTQQTVTWNVANTTASPVSCANVGILLSTDGGLTYPTTLLASTPNDGSQSIVVPSVNTTTARVRVGCTSNVFFDISNVNFTIVPGSAPDFTLDVTPDAQSVCAPANAAYTIDLGSLAGFSSPVTMSASGVPAGATSSIVPNPLTPPGAATLTIGNTGSAAPGSHTLTVNGTGSSTNHSDTAVLNLATQAPGLPLLTSPAIGATNVALQPTLVWSAATQGDTYDVQVATDSTFTQVAATASGLTTTSYAVPAALNGGTTYFWHVRANNACGTGRWSAVFRFTTTGTSATCPAGTSAQVLYSTNFETGAAGWTHSGTGDTWALSTAQAHSGTTSWRAIDSATVSDQRLVSPAVALPTGENPLSLTFWNYQSIEANGSAACYDGAILEVSTNGGSTWTQVPNGDLLTDPYNGPVNASFGNPLAGLNAWCGDPQGWLNSIANLTGYAGQSINLRFRLGSDNSESREGWYVDDVVVQSCQTTCYWPDVNCSCGAGSTTIDVLDVTAAASAWYGFQSTGAYVIAADVNCRAPGGCDGSNDILDIQAVASMWGTACQ
jgi:hypothetical protein